MASQQLIFRVAHKARPDDPAVLTLDGRQSLHDLHLAIQTAFGWDNDHLYSFFMSGRAWDSASEYAMVPKQGSGKRSASQARLERLGLQVGSAFLYLFDYGDEHHFAIRVESVSVAPKPLKQPRIDRRPANPPAQYGDEDGDDEDYEEDELIADEEIQATLVQALARLDAAKLGQSPLALTAALAESDSEDYDWGGDGSDLNDTIRAHVEAALVPTDLPYPAPLEALLHLGDARTPIDWEVKIRELGITQAHVPDLVRMTRDRALNTAMGDTDEVWAPIYAMYALEHFDISACVADLVPLFDVDLDWFGTHLPDVLKHAGAAAFEPLANYMQDTSRWIYGRASAGEAVAKIGEQPELREQAVQIIADVVYQGNKNDPTLNGFLLGDLLELKAVEALPKIRQAFEQDAIDESITGDWQAVLDELGLEPEPDDPLVEHSRKRWKANPLLPGLDTSLLSLLGGAPDQPGLALLPDLLRQPFPAARPSPPKPSSHATPKTKRKMASATKKANKKKKRK